MERVAVTSEGRTFGRLNQDPDYSARFEAGYEHGERDGFELATQQWFDDYADMLKLMADSMATLVSKPRLGVQFLVAGIDELLFRTIDPSSPPLAKNPRYREVLLALRTLGPPGDGSAAPAPDRPGDLDEDVADMLEVAAHADAMRRVPERLWDSNLLEGIDLQIADWVTELESETSSLMPDVLAFNCQPYEQGYLVGSWTSQAIVNTTRRAVEAVLRRIGTDPLILLPATMPEKALDALIQGVAIELLDED
jgi:hypothetical protein